MVQLSSKTVKIRKPRSCQGCWRKFEAGTMMNRQTNIIDGDFCTFSQCLTCKELMKYLEDDDGMYPEGFVSESLENGETPEQLLERLKLLKN